MSEPTALTVRAQFNPLIRLYLLLTIGLQLAASLIGLPFAVIWFCGAGQWWARHYFDRLSCELTPEHLRFRKGIIFTVEKTIPLENIQDVTFIEGPLLRHFHLATLKLETAGHRAPRARVLVDDERVAVPADRAREPDDVRRPARLARPEGLGRRGARPVLGSGVRAPSHGGVVDGHAATPPHRVRGRAPSEGADPRRTHRRVFMCAKTCRIGSSSTALF